MKTKLFTYLTFVFAFLFSANSIFAQLTVSLSSTTNVTCGGNCDGAITVTGAAGSPPYTYSWSPGGMTTATVNGLCAGAYTVVVTDAVAATDTAIIAITSPSPLSVGGFNYTLCQGGNTPLSSSPVGGTPPYVHNWSPPAGLSNNIISNPIASPLTTTIYTLQVTDVNGCIISNTNIVTVEALPVITIGASPSSICLGQSAALTAIGAMAYNWNTGQTNSSIVVSPSSTTTYTVSGISAAGCQSTQVQTINIVASAPLSISVLTNAGCFGGGGGSAIAQISGGQIANAVWSNGQVSNTATNLFAGSYYVTTTDTSGCVNSDTVLITQPTVLMDSLSFTQPSCGLNNGNISTNATGGTAPYSYFWNTGNTANNLNGIEAGIYMVDITDANGCLVSDIATLGTAGGPTITPSVTNITCNNADNGAISVSLSGGTPPYTIYWTDMDSSYTTLNRTNLQAGPYELVVADVNGCQTIFSTTITEPSPIAISFNYVNPTTCISGDGVINSSVIGGVSGFTYLWSNASVTSNLTNMVAGVYTLTATDVNGCTATSEAFLNDNTSLSATGTSVPTNCGTNTGSIDITVINGTGTFSYDWSSGPTTEDISSLFPGNYAVTITEDNTGCATALQFMVNSSTANYAPEVCLVTVDTLDEKNIIVWERPAIGGIKEFVIYRETSTAGIYRYIGTNPIDSLTEMKDTLANTDLHTWKYKISAIDSCGVETGVSEIEHRPIYLTVDTNGVGLPSLVWTSYMGRPYSDYVVKRNANGTGWVDVVTLPASQNSFVDLNCPSGSIEYTIEALFTTTCNSTRGAINTTRSNIKSPTSVVVGLKGNTTVANNVSLFPNPSQDNFTVSLANKTKVNVSVDVVNALGQVVYTTTINESSKSTTINAANWNNDVYFVRINSTEMHSVIKFVKQ